MANFIFMLVFNLMISASFAGTEIQNGGDSSVAEFKNFAREVVYSLPDKLLNDLSQKSKNDLFNIIKNANVLCGDELQIGNSSKEAINYPFETPQRIVLDCKKFRSNSSIYAKYSLVIHEFLFLAFIDDSDYETSSKLIDVFFKLRNNNDSFSKDLVWQASDCNLIQFQNDVELGGNIYFRNQESTTPLKAAIQSGCLLIINELLKMGVVPETSIDIYGAISYLLARSIKSDCNNNDNHCRDVTLSEARLLKLKVTSVLIKSNPQLIDLYFLDSKDFLYLPSDFWIPGRDKLKNCFISSNILHIIAILKDTELYDSLLELGFRPLMNICREWPVI